MAVAFAEQVGCCRGHLSRLLGRRLFGRMSFVILKGAIMRILLVGNYALDNQASMLRYADMLCRHMNSRGHMAEVIQPPIVGGLVAQPTLRKWLGYIDK